MSKRRGPLKCKSYLNVTNEEGIITPILIKDTDGVINKEYQEKWDKAVKKMLINCAKIYANKNVLDLEIIEDK